MTWTASIKIAAAQKIFTTVQFFELKVGDKTVGYRAIFNEKTFENSSLTALCKKLWEVASGTGLTEILERLKAGQDLEELFNGERVQEEWWEPSSPPQQEKWLDF